MKSQLTYIAATLLVAYIVYSAFIPVSIAHSIIVFSLAGLFAYNQFLLSKHTPKLEEEVAKLKSELREQLEQQKETHDKRLSEVEKEMTKLSLNAVKSSPSSSSPSSSKKSYVF